MTPNPADSDGAASGPTRVACDAMFGGVARWLRALGVDASYTAGIDDGELVRHALSEGRVVVSSDRRLFERREFHGGALRGLLTPVGLRLPAQVEFVVGALRLRAGFPRCTLCNGELRAVRRDEVADRVPARSLIWAREFFECASCGHIFWDGTHWRRISAVRRRLAAGAAATPNSEQPAA